MNKHARNNEPWSVLGLFPGAKRSEVKSAYRQLAKKYHPDKHLNSVEFNEKFKNINIAYRQCLLLIDGSAMDGLTSDSATQNEATNGEDSRSGWGTAAGRADFNKTNGFSNENWSNKGASRKTAIDFKDGFGVLKFIKKVPAKFMGEADFGNQNVDFNFFIFSFVEDMFIAHESSIAHGNVASAQYKRVFWDKFFQAIDFFQFQFGKSFFTQEVHFVFLYAMFGVKDIEFLQSFSLLVKDNDFLTQQEKDFLDFNVCINKVIKGFDLLAALCVPATEINKSTYRQEQFYKYFCVFFQQFHNLESYCLLKNDYFYSNEPIALHLMKHNFICFKIFFNEGLFNFNSKIYFKQKWFIVKNALCEFVVKNKVEDFDTCFDVLLFIEGLGWIRKHCDSDCFFDKRFVFYCKQRLEQYYIQHSDEYFLPRSTVTYKKRLKSNLFFNQYKFDFSLRFLRFVRTNYFFESVSVDKVLVSGCGKLSKKKSDGICEIDDKGAPGISNWTYESHVEVDKVYSQLVQMPQKKERVSGFELVRTRNRSKENTSQSENLKSSSKLSNGMSAASKGNAKEQSDNINGTSDFLYCKKTTKFEAKRSIDFKRCSVLKLLLLKIKRKNRDKAFFLDLFEDRQQEVEVKLLTVDGLFFEGFEVCKVFETFWNLKKEGGVQVKEPSIFEYENALITKRYQELIVKNLNFTIANDNERGDLENVLFLFLSAFESRRFKHCFNILNTLGFVQSNFVLLSKINNIFVFELVCYHLIEMAIGTTVDWHNEQLFIWLSLWHEVWHRGKLFSFVNEGAKLSDFENDFKAMSCSNNTIDLMEAMSSQVVCHMFHVQ